MCSNQKKIKQPPGAPTLEPAQVEPTGGAQMRRRKGAPGGCWLNT